MAVEARLVMAGACAIGAAWFGVRAAYRKRSTEFESDRRLFEHMLHRYRTGTTYTQLRLRGVIPPANSSVPVSDSSGGLGGQHVVGQRTDDLLEKAHAAMKRSHAAQPWWVRGVQRLRGHAPPSASACDLDETWLLSARHRLCSPSHQKLPPITIAAAASAKETPPIIRDP